MPIYQDGALWLGPEQWPFPPNSSHQKWFEDQGLPPIGRLFVLPGSQPRLFDIREPALGFGPTTLMVLALLQELLEKAASQPEDVLESAIRRGLTRVRRFHDRGYCRLDELTPVPHGLANEQLYIPYPREVWASEESRYTDALVEPAASGDQLGGAYEITCTFPDGGDFPAPEDLNRVFDELQKQVGPRGGSVLVASPDACARVAVLANFDNRAEENEKFYRERVKDRDAKQPSNSKVEGTVDRFMEDAIKNFELWPHASMQFGKLTIANPHDSGPILDLVQKMQEHVMRHRYLPPKDGKVFSFALFGTPGSGKSTLAREIQGAVDPADEIFSRLEFNISQFAGKDQLIHAFEEVAAQGLGGKVPLVLWDEFDTAYDGRRGGWLSHFLMPMQDAKYFDRHEEKPLGTAVFVFIGGTLPNASTFRRWASGADGRARSAAETDAPAEPAHDHARAQSAGDPERTPESVLLKARDFHSRLFMSLNMPSIIYVDPKETEKRRATVQIIRSPDNDPKAKEDYEKLARSVFLRWLFKDRSKVNKKPRTREVDGDVLQILLNIPLRHGARSLERIVEACLVSKPDQLSRHHLPPYGFLEEHIETMHVVAGDDDGWTPDPENPIQSILEKISKLWPAAPAKQ